MANDIEDAYVKVQTVLEELEQRSTDRGLHLTPAEYNTIISRLKEAAMELKSML